MSDYIRIVGCGRWSMGDDQAGLALAQLLADREIEHCSITLDESPGSGLACECLDPIDLLIVIDAAHADAEHHTGSMLRLDYHRDRGLFGNTFESTTHDLGVPAGLELADALGVLPSQVWLYAIFGDNFLRSGNLGNAVMTALPTLAGQVESDVQEWLEHCQLLCSEPRASARADFPIPTHVQWAKNRYTKSESALTGRCKRRLT